EGIEVLHRLLGANVPEQVVVSVGDLQTRIDNWVNFVAAGDANHDRSKTSAATDLRPSSDSAYRAPTNDVEQSIAEIWQSLLGIDPVGVEDNFFALGGHSLLATQLLSRLRAVFQVELSLRHFFEGPTVARLAEVVKELLRSDENEKLASILEDVEKLTGDELDDA